MNKFWLRARQDRGRRVMDRYRPLAYRRCQEVPTMDALDPTLAPAAAPAIMAAPRAFDASLPRGDWPALFALQRHGVTGAALERLVLLRGACQRRELAADGIEQDPRIRFARWLAETGRLHERA